MEDQLEQILKEKILSAAGLPVSGLARGVILTLESRLPYPEVPPGIAVIPDWEWILGV